MRFPPLPAICPAARPPASPICRFRKADHTKVNYNRMWFDYVHNKENELFRLDYVFEMGVNAQLLPLALVYLLTWAPAAIRQPCSGNFFAFLFVRHQHHR